MSKLPKKELTRSDFEPTLYWKEKPFLLHLANAGLLGGYNLKSIDSLTTLLNRCCEDKSIFGGLGFHLRRFAFFASTLNAGKIECDVLASTDFEMSIFLFWQSWKKCDFFILGYAVGTIPKTRNPSPLDFIHAKLHKIKGFKVHKNIQVQKISFIGFVRFREIVFLMNYLKSNLILTYTVTHPFSFFRLKLIITIKWQLQPLLVLG